MNTGFLAYYPDKEVKEENYFFNASLGHICATNWNFIDRDKIIRLDLWWHGIMKCSIETGIDLWWHGHSDKKASEWIFYHTGCIEPPFNKTQIISRTIGLKNPQKTIFYTVNENTGELTCIYNPMII